MALALSCRGNLHFEVTQFNESNRNLSDLVKASYYLVVSIVRLDRSVGIVPKIFESMGEKLLHTIMELEVNS